VYFAGLKWCFCGRNIDNDDLLQLVARAEIMQVVLNAFESMAGGGVAWQIASIGETSNGRAAVEQGARPQVRFPALQIFLAGIGEGRLEDIGTFL